jgi:hypothetical protein
MGFEKIFENFQFYFLHFFFNFLLLFNFVTFYLHRYLKSITPEINEQTELVRKEYIRLRELIDDEMLDKTFIRCAD